MDPRPSIAPADHFSVERQRLKELRARLAALHKQLPLIRRMAGGAHHGLISACAGVFAYLAAHALGLEQSFWSTITAISVVQTEFQATESTARDQFIGAAIGGSLGMCAAFVPGPHLILYAAAIVVSMLTCWALNVASASRLSGTTATIILLVPHTGSPERMFAVRLTEVGWGVCVAIAVVWLAGRVPARWLDRTGQPAAGMRPP
jgi:uncharacterized membrane protein YgaE (UPF0421/DUF939 family)